MFIYTATRRLDFNLQSRPSRPFALASWWRRIVVSVSSSALTVLQLLRLCLRLRLRLAAGPALLPFSSQTTS